MGITDFFKKKDRSKQDSSPSHWLKCPSCSSVMFYKEVKSKNYVCPKCNYHLKLYVDKRIDLLSDKDSFKEMDTNLKPNDPLKFADKKKYADRIKENYKKTGRYSSVVAGECTINGMNVQLVVFDFQFMGGSLGSVEGEKIFRAGNRSLEKNEPLIIVSASGGARMQESTFALMQMSKTSAIISKLNEASIPYISILTDPTYGGVSASFAFLGDIIMAEPKAMIGFAGPRVIKQTIGAELPKGFQTSEFLLNHGLIDMIVERNSMKDTIFTILSIFTRGDKVEELIKEEIVEEVTKTEEVKKTEKPKKEVKEKPKEKKEKEKAK